MPAAYIYGAEMYGRRRATCVRLLFGPLARTTRSAPGPAIWPAAMQSHDLAWIQACDAAVAANESAVGKAPPPDVVEGDECLPRATKKRRFNMIQPMTTAEPDDDDAVMRASHLVADDAVMQASTPATSWQAPSNRMRPPIPLATPGIIPHDLRAEVTTLATRPPPNPFLRF